MGKNSVNVEWDNHIIRYRKISPRKKLQILEIISVGKIIKYQVEMEERKGLVIRLQYCKTKVAKKEKDKISTNCISWINKQNVQHDRWNRLPHSAMVIQPNSNIKGKQFPIAPS